MAVSLTLPYPPSANRLWRSVPKLKSPIKSREYLAWIKAAQACIPMTARDEIKGQFRVLIEADRPDRRARDLDNLTKPLLDVLCPTNTHKGVIEDDHLAIEITSRWTSDEPKKPALVRVTIEGK